MIEEITSKEEFEDALQILFENLDTRGWEDSFKSTTFNREPGTLIKQTVEEKVDIFRENIFKYVDKVCG